MTTGLDPAQLAAFAAVIEEGSFDAAARRLHVTPSAVSQRIKALESRVGQILVRRAIDAGELVEIAPGRWLDVPLYWQRWRLESPALAALTAAVHTAAAAGLRPV